jgi:CRP-like cAMP-binding protein
MSHNGWKPTLHFAKGQLAAIHSLSAAADLRGAYDALLGADLFQDAEPMTLAQLASHAVHREYAAGQLIFRQGDVGEVALVISSGTVDVATSHRGREVTLATRESGDCIGEMSVVSGAPRSATVRARTDICAFALSGHALRAALRRDSVLAERISKQIDRLSVDAFLKLSSPFARLSSTTIWELAGQLRRRTLVPGETLIQQGDVGDCFYLIVSGRFEVVRRGEWARVATTIARLGPGDCVGEATLVTRAPRNATVRALDGGEVLELSRSAFEQAVLMHSGLRDFFRELFLARYRSAPQQLLQAVDPVLTLMPGLRASQARRIYAIFAAGIVILALLSAASMGTNNLSLTLGVLALGVMLPAACYVAYIRERDLIRQTPVRTLLVVGLIAGAIGVPVALYLEILADLPHVQSTLLTALIEEPLKLLATVWVMSRRQYRFILDGVIFGITAAVGFGAFESAGYAVVALVEPMEMCGTTNGISCMVSTVWLRMIGVFLGHGPWTAIICATLWRERSRRAHPLTWPMAGMVGLVVVLHTLWNLNPILLGLPLSIVSMTALRALLREGLQHQAAALRGLSFLSANEEFVTNSDQSTCPQCATQFPTAAYYCARCGLALI